MKEYHQFPHRAQKSQVLFEMNPNLRMRVDGPNGRKFRICPVSKLATLTVQIGYRREISEPASEGIQNAASSLVRFNTRLPDALGKQSFWYPGIRNLGEGLFIRFDEDGGWHPKMKGDSSKEWMDTYSDTNQEVYDSSLFRSGNNIPREELHPVFVWWHILAHTLIRTISEEAGYSSASIQERVYLESVGDKVRGGILLYATQPGSEGSLGGLISLAPYFESMLEIALGQLQTCSGDPLCLEDHFKNKKLNGSACYACVMNSETSCEFRNMWLDRHVLLDNMP